eukprot:12824958-Alexandrium_andersonii.AAC.1
MAGWRQAASGGDTEAIWDSWSRAVERGLCAAAGWQPGTEQAKAARGHGRVLLRKGRGAAGGRELRIPR